MLARTLALLLAVCLAPAGVRAEGTVVPRTVLALYDGKEFDDPSDVHIHRTISMPLNYLGLVVVYHDIREGLPPEHRNAGLRGIVTWFSDAVVPDPAAYLDWINTRIDAGVRVVVFDHPGVAVTAQSSARLREDFTRFTHRLGIDWLGTYHDLNFGAGITYRHPVLTEMERPYPPLLPAYNGVRATDGAEAHLSVANRGARHDLIVTGSSGGYASGRFAFFFDDEQVPPIRQWYLNPFLFFRTAFATESLPKPDLTTMSGRRLYYSHIDGDGWHNGARQFEFRKKGLNAADVLYREIFRKYDDLPVTLGPVSADLDPDWYGDEAAHALAREIFALPHVEAGSHTHSHPFAWGFFRNYVEAKERPFLDQYPPRPGKTLGESVFDPAAVDPEQRDVRAGSEREEFRLGYDRPRAYAVQPFDLASEIGGSVDYISRFLPPGKRVEIMLWSGDTLPFPKAMEATKQARLRNINGGDTRMYRIYDSYAWVASYGRWSNGHWQPYTSNANDNIYSDNWRGRFFGLVFSIETFRNTETPIRVTPLNLYYHLFVAEREQGLSSLRAVLDHVRTLEIAPVTASRYAAMADGFVGARFLELETDRWRVVDRDGLETVRFEPASLRCVDFDRSAGIVGQRHHQGSLYVALDGAVAQPVIALGTCATPWRTEAATRPYLVDARWRVFRLGMTDDGFSFAAEGFGTAEFRWFVPRPGTYRVTVSRDAVELGRFERGVGEDGMLRFGGPDGPDIPAGPGEFRFAVERTAD